VRIAFWLQGAMIGAAARIGRCRQSAASQWISNGPVIWAPRLVGKFFALGRREQCNSAGEASLVDRSTYPTKFTVRSRGCLKVAEEVVRALHAIRRDFTDDRQRETDIINIAALHTLSLTFFPKWIGQLGE
jgi:hypothetical protein